MQFSCKDMLVVVHATYPLTFIPNEYALAYTLPFAARLEQTEDMFPLTLTTRRDALKLDRFRETFTKTVFSDTFPVMFENSREQPYPDPLYYPVTHTFVTFVQPAACSPNPP